jgi:hypothetical protein
MQLKKIYEEYIAEGKRVDEAGAEGEYVKEEFDDLSNLSKNQLIEKIGIELGMAYDLIFVALNKISPPEKMILNHVVMITEADAISITSTLSQIEHHFQLALQSIDRLAGKGAEKVNLDAVRRVVNILGKYTEIINEFVSGLPWFKSSIYQARSKENLENALVNDQKLQIAYNDFMDATNAFFIVVNADSDISGRIDLPTVINVLPDIVKNALPKNANLENIKNKIFSTHT